MNAEHRLNLLRLENAFYRSCAAVRLSGKELAEVQVFLMQELLAIEGDKRRTSDRAASERIRELEVRQSCFDGQ